MLRNNKLFVPLLLLMLLATIFASIVFGAVKISGNDIFNSMVHFFQGKEFTNIHEGVFMQIRAPRVLLCAVAGAILSSSGVLMQGLFRNPIVEPGLIGTSAGAAFGASLIFVMSASISTGLKETIGPLLVPLFAFGGGLLATILVYSLSKNVHRVSITSLLLIGIAVNAIGLSGTGFMSYIARDPQARSITFWNLGTFSGANWNQFLITAIIAFITLSISLRYSKQLNALLLGEDEALYLGVNAAKLKLRIMLLNTAMVSVCTAFVGVISFMGLIVPHVLRMLIGSDNRKLLPASMILGAILLLLADMLARLLLAPAEIPIGIITSFVGAPVFIILLKRFNTLQAKGGFYD